MNREERRDLRKKGASDKTIDTLNKYDQPCKISEVIKISRAVAEDVAKDFLDDYRKRSSGVIMSISLQLELLKTIAFSKGAITEEEFNKLYEKSAEELEQQQKDYIDSLRKKEESNTSASTDVDFSSKHTDSVEIKVME